MGKFLYLKAVTIPADGNVVSLDVSGSSFVCTASTGTFQVSFDGQGFCDWMKGLTARQEFSRLLFKSSPGATQPNRVEFFHGNIDVGDSRLNVINNSQLATIQTIPPRTFLTVYSDLAASGTATNFPAASTLQLDDPVTDPVSGLQYRRSEVTIQNLTGAVPLYVGLASTGPGLVSQVFAEIPVGDTPMKFELSGTLFVCNTAAARRVRIMDKFYDDPEIFS